MTVSQWTIGLHQPTSQVMNNEQILSDFGKRLKELRKAQNVSQEELAHRVGFDRTYISLLERGKRNPSLISIHNLAVGLETSAKEFFE